MNKYYVYILCNKPYGTLYIGVTNNVSKRIDEHKLAINSFTYKYKVFKLVYIEKYSEITEAIAREKQLKSFRREWKIALINEANPYWNNLL